MDGTEEDDRDDDVHTLTVIVDSIGDGNEYTVFRRGRKGDGKAECPCTSVESTPYSFSTRSLSFCDLPKTPMLFKDTATEVHSLTLTPSTTPLWASRPGTMTAAALSTA